MSSPEIMKKIMQAEKEARLIQDETERDVSRMKKDLQNRITMTREEILQQATEQREMILTEAEKAGSVEAEHIASDSKGQVQALSRVSESKRKQAVEKAMTILLSESPEA